MSNLTNATYRANPSFREQLEVEARKLRQQEIRCLVVQPLVNLWKRTVKNATSRPARRVSESV